MTLIFAAEPKRANPMTERPLPTRTIERRLQDDPKWKKDNTDAALPMRANERSERELPRWAPLNTDKGAFNAGSPAILRAEPILLKLRKLRVEPKLAKLN
jgi:hypothetical protein